MARMWHTCLLRDPASGLDWRWELSGLDLSFKLTLLLAESRPISQQPRYAILTKRDLWSAGGLKAALVVILRHITDGIIYASYVGIAILELTENNVRSNCHDILDSFEQRPEGLKAGPSRPNVPASPNRIERHGSHFFINESLVGIEGHWTDADQIWCID